MLSLSHMAISARKRTLSSALRTYSRDPLDRVASIAGVDSNRTPWRYSQAAAIGLIEQGTDQFLFHVGDATVKLVVVNRGGEKYLQSEREKSHPDDVFSLTARPAVFA